MKPLGTSGSGPNITCASFAPGHKFKLEEYPVASETGPYVLREVTHEIRDRSYFAGKPPAEVKPSFVAIGLLTGALTGLLAGLAPAAAAARLPPVEALRHE